MTPAMISSTILTACSTSSMRVVGIERLRAVHINDSKNPAVPIRMPRVHRQGLPG